MYLRLLFSSWGGHLWLWIAAEVVGYQRRGRGSWGLGSEIVRLCDAGGFEGFDQEVLLILRTLPCEKKKKNANVEKQWLYVKNLN